MRGNLRTASLTLYGHGSIPACAGEPPPCSAITVCSSVYPRVCGGTVPKLLVPPKTLGLSPRVRGNPVKARRIRRIVGSIPACAGEPRASPTSSTRPTVYPRVCGGTRRRRRRRVLPLGLSPRVRGNQMYRRCHRCRSRSIPACAGEPLGASVTTYSFRVYPRVCGGTGFGGIVGNPSSGLSPRVRGNLPLVTAFTSM